MHAWFACKHSLKTNSFYLYTRDSTKIWMQIINHSLLYREWFIPFVHVSELGTCRNAFHWGGGLPESSRPPLTDWLTPLRLIALKFNTCCLCKRACMSKLYMPHARQLAVEYVAFVTITVHARPKRPFCGIRQVLRTLFKNYMTQHFKHCNTKYWIVSNHGTILW